MPGVCWYCERPTQTKCDCGRLYCRDHALGTHCMVCALGFGLYEQAEAPEPLSDYLILGLSAAANDPYLVKPSRLNNIRPMPLDGVERTVSVILRMLQAEDAQVRHRAASVLVNTTNSWPTMDPSQLAQHRYGTGLFVTYQVRRWLLHVLQQSRPLAYEQTALVILEKLATTDFRDLYPGIADNLKRLTPSNIGARVQDLLDAIVDFYPTHSAIVNERCELLLYEQYTNQARGAGKTMERIYGPLLKYSPLLRQMLKKGTWLSNRRLYESWYYGEEEPLD